MNIKFWTYRWFYTYLTPMIKRPWTFFTRDLWHETEYIPIMLLLFAGWFSGRYWDEIFSFLAGHPIWALFATWATASLWFTAGHIFWGTKYIKGQR